MNTVWIVMPILLVLMFLLGTDLNRAAFENVIRNPRSIAIGLLGQLVFLPLIAFVIAWLFDLSPIYFMGVVLVACCPGGSSSNVFTMLVKGDVALSVTLTAISSIITLFTLPFVMDIVSSFVSNHAGVVVDLPVGKLLIQNIVLLLLPMLLGIVFRHLWPKVAQQVNKTLSKVAFPALMFLVLVFFLQYTREIMDHFAVLGLVATVLIFAAMMCSSLLARMSRFNSATRRTIVIEVGMQNAAQAIAISTSPFIFNSGEMAIPAIIYALLMNIILLLYVLGIRKSH